VGCWPRISAASTSDTAGWSSSISEDTTAGSRGSDAVMSSQPAVWLSSASMASQPMAGQSGCRVRPPKTRPNASDAIAVPADASATGPAMCAVPADERRRISRNPA